MSYRDRYAEELRGLRSSDPEYQIEELSLAVSEAIRDRMKSERISQTELAKKLGVSKACVSQLLNAERCNLTLQRLARLANALNARLAWDFRPLASEGGWQCDERPADPEHIHTVTTTWGTTDALALAA